MPGDHSASAAELTCKQWFEYGHRSYLPHGKSERMAEIRAAVTATFDTIEVMRAGSRSVAGKLSRGPTMSSRYRTQSFPHASENGGNIPPGDVGDESSTVLDPWVGQRIVQIP